MNESKLSTFMAPSIKSMATSLPYQGIYGVAYMPLGASSSPKVQIFSQKCAQTILHLSGQISSKKFGETPIIARQGRMIAIWSHEAFTFFN